MLSITWTQIVQNLWLSERSKTYANDRQAAKEGGVVDGIELALRKLSIPFRIIQHFCEYIERIGKRVVSLQTRRNSTSQCDRSYGLSKSPVLSPRVPQSCCRSVQQPKWNDHSKWVATRGWVEASFCATAMASNTSTQHSVMI